MGQYESIYNGSQIDDCVSQAVRTIVQQLTDEQKSQVRTNIGAGTYSIPSGGIPKTSLTTDVQTSLLKADNALPLSGGTMTGYDINFINNLRHLSAITGSTSRAGRTFPSLGDASIGLFAQVSNSADEGAVIISPDTCVVYNSFDTGWGFQVHNEDSGIDMSTDTTRVFGINELNSKYYAWSRDGFQKAGSSDSYVLLGGGGHAAISGLSVSYATSAGTATDNTKVPLSGGTMTGALTVKQYIFGYNFGHAGINAPAFVFDKSGANFTGIGANGEADTIYFSAATISNDEASWVTSYKQKWKFNGTIYQEDNAVIHAGNIGSQSVSYATSAGTATDSTKLPLAGGTMTGTLNLTHNAVQMNFRTGHGSYNSKIEYMTLGDEAMVWANQNEVTSFIFKCGLDLTNASDWTGITPSLQIKNQSVYINSLIANGTTPSYNLYVNGSACVSNSAYFCTSGGNCGIGTTHPSYKLHVVGTCLFGGTTFVCYTHSSGSPTPPSNSRLIVGGGVAATGGFDNFSDVRYKNIIEDVNLSIKSIADVPIFKYTWKNENMGHKVNVGTSAQYWKTILPEIVSESEDSDRTLSMQYDVAGLVSSIVLAKKVVEQEETIKLQDTRIKELEKIVDDIQSELDKQKL